MARAVRVRGSRIALEHRTVIVLHDLQGLDYAECAEALGVPVGTVKSRLHRARLQLARELGVDADRDIMGGALKPYRDAQMPAEFLPKEPLWKSIWVGRALAVILLFIGGGVLGAALNSYFLQR